MAKKIKDHDKMLDDLLSEDQKNIPQFEKENFTLEPLLEEIDMIVDQQIKQFVRSVLLKATLFWEIPSVFSEVDNPPDEHDIGGQVLHTKRVFRICQLICESYTGILSSTDKDVVLAAALLHGVTKGVLMNGTPTFDEFYPYTVDRFVSMVRREDEVHATENESSVLYIQEAQVLRILRLIRCQRGPWSPIPETFPIDPDEMILHIADHIASKLHWVIDGDDFILARWKM